TSGPGVRSRGEGQHAGVSHPDSSRAGKSAGAERSLTAARAATDEAAGPLERHSRAAFSAPGFGSAIVECLPLSGAVPADLRGVLLAGMRPGAEARPQPAGSRDRFSTDGPGAGTHQANAAVQTHRCAEARAGGDRARYGGSASDVP